ncbi:UPF0187-domain-containing protein [Laetiporus sulphureus 93-53]|uniref:UPF0187-domain-containing protein n=1 Tax=Laetiporus sulphureus 93-53 TaxID=1314785 RepID=A0A165CHJ4_9APHY|nr:UPF0187-domain-containing protein [Laetiporus sulphureus 93-53]KZT02826.1 UPF0187-domain-containing protein [Laetiporus sulphureus 93-53]
MESSMSHAVDPFAHTQSEFFCSLANAISATALIRCWPLLVFFSAWATMISVVSVTVRDLGIQSTLLTVIGTVLGFVISYRTTSSFERYNEGRRLWSQIVLASRTFTRTVWFHVPDVMPPDATSPVPPPVDQRKLRTLIEKKTVINLVEGFAVAVKHYLRGEEGVYYEDLFHLVKFLPSYALPPGIPSALSLAGIPAEAEGGDEDKDDADEKHADSVPGMRSFTSLHSAVSQTVLPLPVTSPTQPSRRSHGRHRSASARGTAKVSFDQRTVNTVVNTGHHRAESAETVRQKTSIPSLSAQGHETNFSVASLAPPSMDRLAVKQDLDVPADNGDGKAFFSTDKLSQFSKQAKGKASMDTTAVLATDGEGFLLPAYIPPKYHLLDLFPLSLFVHWLAGRGKDVKGKTAARIRAKLRNKTVTHNLPLEISFYLSSYTAALQSRKVVDPPTSTALMNALNQLVDALTGLERILTTPIPFSYRVHLWTVTVLYNLLLPFQIWNTLGWLTIPATTLLSFIFFGFLVAGEEIENPFGYDKNDLNLDHFTHSIIRNELRALTALPVPDPSVWAFSQFNDQILGSGGSVNKANRATPDEWMNRGYARMVGALYEAV